MHACAAGARCALRVSPTRARRTPRDALFPRGTTSAARDATSDDILRGSRASARTSGIAPDLRPTERAPQTQDRAYARAPDDRPARRTQPRGCVVAPRPPPPHRTLFFIPVGPPNPIDSGDRVVRRARRDVHARSSRSRRRPPFTAGLRASVRARAPRPARRTLVRATYTGSSPLLPPRRERQSAWIAKRLAQIGPPRARPRRRRRRRATPNYFFASRDRHRDSPAPDSSPSRAQASLPSRA